MFKFTSTFNSSTETVYNAISKMLYLNTKQFNDKVTDKTNLLDMSYEYQTKGDLKVTVKVTETIKNERIVYVTAMETKETYAISFDLVALTESSCTLTYEQKLVTDKKLLTANHSFMKWLYLRRQKKTFKAMCQYLETLCIEK